MNQTVDDPPLLVVEFASGGGEFLAESVELAPALQTEGRNMRDALVHSLAHAAASPIDFFTSMASRTERQSRSADAVNETIIDSAEIFWSELDRYCEDGAAVWLIAPETDGWLLKLSEFVVERGGHLATPDPDFVRLCSDKTDLLRFLARHQILTPEQRPHPRGLMIRKPRDGCGSQAIQLIAPELAPLEPSPHQQPVTETSKSNGWHDEPFIEGLPVSVSCISTRAGVTLLPPFEQIIERERGFEYLGGRTIREEALVLRAWNLARQIADALPSTRGYWGIDMILSKEIEEAVVLEVNPRLTSSLEGLRLLLSPEFSQLLLGATESHLPAVFRTRPAIEFRVNQPQVAKSFEAINDR